MRPHLGIDRVMVLVQKGFNNIAINPAFEFFPHPHLENLQLIRVRDAIAENRSFDLRGEKYAKLARGRVIAENVHSELRAAVAEPDEPTPVFLIVPDTLVVFANHRQEPSGHTVAAPATLVEVDLGIVNRNSFGEAELEGHKRYQRFETKWAAATGQ